MLADRFGRSPEEVENWDAYWFNRAGEFLEGEAIYLNGLKPKNRR